VGLDSEGIVVLAITIPSVTFLVVLAFLDTSILLYV